MSRYHVATTTVAAAPIEVVWARLADITTWSEWGDWDETTRVRDGGPPPDGVGALRQFRRGRRTHVEEVVAFEPSRRLAYEVRARRHDYQVAFATVADLVFMLAISPWEIPGFGYERDIAALLALEREALTPAGIILSEGRYLLFAHKPAKDGG